MNQRLITLAVAVAAFGLAACQTAPETSSILAQAREAVRQAESNADVSRFSANDLAKARNLLVNAEGAANERGANDEVAAHYAYLATQTAHIAEQRAAEQLAIARIKAGETERQEILLAARESEANRAQMAAEQARTEAQTAKSQLALARSEQQRLSAQLEELQAEQTSRGIVLTLDDVLFDTGRADLKAGAQRTLDQIAAFLSDNPERSVQIEGFTDAQGSNDFNQQLSQRRADAVARAIIQRGIESERVRALGYGEEFPVASNATAGSRQMNRRVEVIVSNGDGEIPSRTAQEIQGGQ